MECRRPNHPGWTIAEAIQHAVNPELLSQLAAAEQKWRDAGAPRRFVISIAYTRDDDWQYEKHNRFLKSLYDAVRIAKANVYKDLRHKLLSGKLVAWGRLGGSMGELTIIPAPAWKVLRFHSPKNSIVKEGKDVLIYDVQIYQVADVLGDSAHEMFRVNTTEPDYSRLNAPRKAAPTKGTKLVVTKARARNECREWLIAQLKASPNKKLRIKKDLWDEANRLWGKKLSKRAFLGVWDEGVRLTKAYVWAAAGAPRKKSPR